MTEPVWKVAVVGWLGGQVGVAGRERGERREGGGMGSDRAAAEWSQTTYRWGGHT